jgi:hypothetical protein
LVPALVKGRAAKVRQASEPGHWRAAISAPDRAVEWAGRGR